MKKHSSFLFVVLLSVCTSSFPMGSKDQKAPVGNQTAQTSATATAANTTPEQPAKIITSLLMLAKLTLLITEFSSNMPVTQSEIISLLDDSKVVLKDLSTHNEFAKTYIQDADELVAKLLNLYPVAKSLFDRHSQFIEQTQQMPTVVAWSQRMKVMIPKIQEACEIKKKEIDELLKKFPEKKTAAGK